MYTYLVDGGGRVGPLYNERTCDGFMSRMTHDMLGQHGFTISTNQQYPQQERQAVTDRTDITETQNRTETHGNTLKYDADCAGGRTYFGTPVFWGRFVQGRLRCRPVFNAFKGHPDIVV